MPSTVLPSIPHRERIPLTNEPLEYADLAVVDLSRGETAEGRMELAAQVADAMSNVGFFYIINHGLSQAQNDRMFDVADVPFSLVPEDEMKAYTTSFEDIGRYLGYKNRRQWHVNGGIYDEIEQYNMDRDVMKEQHPRAMRPLLPEIDSFVKFCHYQVLYPILRLLALGLGLPEETFVKIHGFDDNNETSIRFMNFPRAQDEEDKADNVWLKGHTDIGSVSILWSQPISALQILSPDGKWRWIRHIDNALVINAGDVMEFLSGGYYKATIHRVVQPPADQRGHARVGLFYFVKCNDDVKLVPFAESPVLQKHGITRLCDDVDAPTMLEWRNKRTSAYGVTKLEKKENGRIEEEIISGVVVKHYN
ncbi:uncharacterized protein FIBRA_08421 [Fibroporia radiculosa]|uniref:Fe2OG dioxygenase domain-containing protein n=1 Tax=Fibroporia radiculosa TaxID=599839 RepID=J4H561_9APHY|nr:uncharacterized protein FIBRA_08421 [Fibroporia radiculosa]CCM06179.1 predicted protein [Fibroporia radiculosa]